MAVFRGIREQPRGGLLTVRRINPARGQQTGSWLRCLAAGRTPDAEQSATCGRDEAALRRAQGADRSVAGAVDELRQYDRAASVVDVGGDAHALYCLLQAGDVT